MLFRIVYAQEDESREGFLTTNNCRLRSQVCKGKRY